jgi:hypothetical protein
MHRPFKCPAVVLGFSQLREDQLLVVLGFVDLVLALQDDLLALQCDFDKEKGTSSEFQG